VVFIPACQRILQVELFGDDTGLARLGFTLKEVRKMRETKKSESPCGVIL
jgi:hypothetical protein